MRRLLLFLAFIAAACTPRPVLASPPAAFGVPMEVRGDTARVSFEACAITAPSVGCRVTPTGAVGGTAITFPTIADLAPGQSTTLSVNITCTDRAPVSITIASRGFNADGVLSTATSATGTATCPAGSPTQPQPFTVTIQIRSGP